MSQLQRRGQWTQNLDPGGRALPWWGTRGPGSTGGAGLLRPVLPSWMWGQVAAAAASPPVSRPV